MNIKTIITIATVFCLTSPVYAAEYPTIAGITISKDTTASEYVVYFFNLLVAIGAFIAVIMVISGGIDWVMSNGDPGKVSSGKKKIINTLFGVGVLLGCYLILNTINPQLTTVNIDNLYCEHGVVVKAKSASNGNIKQQCIDSSQTDIKDTILSTVKWTFPDKYLLKVYTYSAANYSGNITEFDCSSGTCSGEIAGAKSIYFLLNKPGAYLYDGNSYAPTNPAVKGYPLFTDASIPDLSKTNSFDNFIKSIQIVNPEQTEDQRISYYAVVFRDQNYMGRCAFVGQSIPDMDTSSKGNGYYTDTVGDGTISSIIIAKSKFDQKSISQDRGKVILYTKTDCGKSDTDPTKQIKSCAISISSSASGLKNIFDADVCGGTGDDDFKDGDEVMSFEITGDAGLVLSTSPKDEGSESTSCMYFSKQSLSGGTCYKSIRNSPIFTVGGRTPKSLIIIPNN
jgi:hypothetical protein